MTTDALGAMSGSADLGRVWGHDARSMYVSPQTQELANKKVKETPDSDDFLKMMVKQLEYSNPFMDNQDPTAMMTQISQQTMTKQITSIAELVRSHFDAAGPSGTENFMMQSLNNALMTSADGRLDLRFHDGSEFKGVKVEGGGMGAIGSALEGKPVIMVNGKEVPLATVQHVQVAQASEGVQSGENA